MLGPRAAAPPPGSAPGKRTEKRGFRESPLAPAHTGTLERADLLFPSEYSSSDHRWLVTATGSGRSASVLSRLASRQGAQLLSCASLSRLYRLGSLPRGTASRTVLAEVSERLFRPNPLTRGCWGFQCQQL